jgi:hypothetical protein
MKWAYAVAGLIGMMAVAPACTGNDLTAPSDEPVVRNSVNEFHFQSHYLSPTTRTFTYWWAKYEPHVDVDHTGRIDSGEAHIALRDPAGNEIVGRTDTPRFWLSAGVDSFPFPAMAGTWAITVQLDAVVGVVNYRVISGPSSPPAVRPGRTSPSNNR